MKRILVAVVLAGLALLGLSGPANARGVERPWKVDFYGGTTAITYAPGFDFAKNPWATDTFGGRCPAGASWVITNGGTGSGTYLGDFTWLSVHCTKLTSLSPPNAEIYGGRLDFKADNGDVLRETYVAAGGITLRGDQFCAPTAATFVGGTGRFLNASGSAIEDGCWPASIQGPVIHDLVVHSRGTITFDASDRSRR